MVAKTIPPTRQRSGSGSSADARMFVPDAKQIQKHQRELSARIRHQAKLSRADDVKRSLISLFIEEFNENRLDQDDRDQYQHNVMLSWEPYKTEIIQTWKNIKERRLGQRKIGKEVNRIIRFMFSGGNVVNRIRNTHAATQKRTQKERELVARKLLGDSVRLRFLDVLPAEGRQKGIRLLLRPEGYIEPGEVFAMDPIDMLDEFWSSLSSGNFPYFETIDPSVKDVASKCCNILATIYQHGEGVSQTNLIKKLFGVAGGKRYQQYAEIIGTLLNLGLLRQEGNGPAARLKLGTRPRAKGEVIGRRKKNLPTEIDDNKCDRILDSLAGVRRFPRHEPTKSRQPKT